MCRASEALIAGSAALLLISSAVAQAPEEPVAQPMPAIEKYLSDRNLHELLAIHLLQRLKTADKNDQLTIADRLGSLYVGLLDEAKSAADRTRWEQQSQELLKLVPEADSFNLRLNLAKARYLQSEEVAEKQRLRLATPEERQEAEQTLRSVGALFQDIASKLNKRVDQLERREGTARDDEAATIRADLSESRRLRSLAFYYAGWSRYYEAFLSGRPQLADEALNDFGWLLNAGGGRQPTVERAPASLLRYEHVSRAAIGAALCESIRGRDATAERWLSALEEAEGVSPGILKQLFSRRLVVLAQGKRWDEVERLLKKRREVNDGKSSKPLETAEARLLAVLTLEALEQAQPKSKELVQALADTALTDLVTLGEVKHVQDLVSKFGSAPLAGNGFIVQYVRGLQAYERARAAHGSAGSNIEEPATDASIVNLYRDAATALANAAGASDASRFGDELSNATLLRGLATYYAGDLKQAADRFEQAFQAAQGGKRSEDALWMAIVALDKALEGGDSVQKERLAKLGALYLQKFPKSDRSAKLLLRQATTGIVSDEKAVEVLLGVDKTSPLYETARRQAASLLYGVYRRSRGNERDFAALRFAEVSDEILRMDQRKLTQAQGAEAQDIATLVVARVRQTLDAVLSMTAPDLERADKALEVFDAVVTRAGYDTRKLDDEITYRRFQIALARSRTEDITRLLDKLHAIRGPFSDRADRAIYNRALVAAKSADATEGALRDLVQSGLRVMDQFGRTVDAVKDPAVYSLQNTVSDAAARLYRVSQDRQMRDVSMTIDKVLLQAGNAPLPVLRRYAELGESAGDREGALDCWRTILAGAGTTSPAWFEARFNSLRLLLSVDAEKAREAMVQYKVLHPDFGPEPWGTMLKELDLQMGSPTAKPDVIPKDKSRERTR